MGGIGVTFPVDPWLTGYVVDPDLYGAIAKARAEFENQSEENVRALWLELEGALVEWGKVSGHSMPTYYSPVRRLSDGTHLYVDGAPGDEKPNFVALFQTLFTQQYRPVVAFIQKLDPNGRLALCKALALLILREAGDGNPPGALRASALFDRLAAPLRPLVDDALRVRKGRRLGARKGRATRSREVDARNRKLLARANALRASGRTAGQVLDALEAEFRLSRRQLRRVLQHKSPPK